MDEMWTKLDNLDNLNIIGQSGQNRKNRQKWTNLFLNSLKCLVGTDKIGEYLYFATWQI